MALVGLNGLTSYGFYVPLMALRLFELHLVIEPNHPIVHEEILLFIPVDCFSINIYLHGKVENFHRSFLHTLVERIYDQKVEGGIIDFSRTFLISTHTNNYDAYESKMYKSISILFPQGENRNVHRILMDGLEATVYTDLKMKVADYGECIRIEISRKGGEPIKAGIVALRFSVVMSSPEKKEQYNIHIFSPEVLGGEYTIFPDEKKAISNSSILTLIHKENGLREIKEFLEKGKEKIHREVEEFFKLKESEKNITRKATSVKDIFGLIDRINALFEEIKGEVRSYFLDLKRKDQDILKAHSDIWLQIPEFVTQCEPPKHARMERYSWDFAFNIKPANVLVSKYFLDKTNAYHIYIADERTQVFISPEEGGITEKFNLRFKVEPNFLLVFMFPIYFILSFFFRALDKIMRNFFEGWDFYSNIQKSLGNFHKLNMVKYNLFLKEIYTSAFQSQNIVTIILVFVSLMFTLASIIKGETKGSVSHSDYLSGILHYFHDVLKLIKDPVFIVPLIFSSFSLAFIYLYTSYKEIKGKWK